MTIDSVGSVSLVNDLVLQSQSTEGGAVAVALSVENEVVVFNGHGPADGSGVYGRVLDEAGAVVRDDFLVNTTTTGDQHSASVASDALGNFVVAWAGRGVGDTDGVFFQRFNAAGEAQGDETRANTTVAGVQTDPTIAINDDGSFAIGWSGQSTSDATGVYLQRFDASGMAVGDEVLVNTTTADHQANIDLVYDSAGNLVAAWSSLGQGTGDWDIVGQRFNSDGDRIGATEFAWNSTTADAQKYVSLAAGPDGEVVAAWQSRGQDGDGWGIVARRLDADGSALADEVMLNDATAGQQVDVHLAIAEDGQWIAVWATAEANGAGWEVMARTFEPDATPEGASAIVHEENSGANSGHQRYASVAAVGEKAVVVWSGVGAADRDGVHQQNYEVELIDDGPPEPPEIETVGDVPATVDTQVEITVTATDPNGRDELTFTLDAANSPADATMEQIDNNTAIVRWTPTAADEGQAVAFRVVVEDDSDAQLSDMEDFTVTVANVPPQIDLNGSEISGTDLSAVYVPGSGPASIVDELLEIVGANDSRINSASVVLDETPDGQAERLDVDLLDTNLTKSYDQSTRTLTITGADTAANYERVLRTLTYRNSVSEPTGTRIVSIEVTDDVETSSAARVEIAIGSIDLVALAQSIADSGARFFGAAWCPVCTDQKELFEDGGKLLPFEEVTNPDRTLNQLGIDNNIQTFPTWVFSDDTRLEGLQSIQALAAAAGVDLPVSETPYLAEIPDDTLLVGSPLHVPLDGYDPNGEELSYMVTTNNPNVTAELLTGNRSMRVDVAGFGDMVFELFEQRAGRATERVIDLAMEDFYDDVIFHRVLDDFVIQGGDPLGTGGGGSDKGDFDDQFHVDLQHNRTGLLSYAKSNDDTNDSQFFITEGDGPSLRNLDFNHTVFGILVEGEANRQAISEMAVERQNPANPTSEVSRPTVDIVMEDVEIFADNENATLLLKAAEGVSGPVEVTVTVTNSAGNSFERKFTVQVTDDTFNGRPFLGDIDPVTIEMNTSAVIQLTSTDVEGDPVVYEATQLGSVDYTFDLTDEGLLTVTPPDGFTGTMEIGVLVRRISPTSATDFDAQLITIEVVESLMDM